MVSIIAFAAVSLSLSITYGAHDHATHPDPVFVRGECARVAQNSLDDIAQEIQKYIKDMDFIEDLHNRHIDQSSEEQTETAWRETYQPQYRELYDHILILSEVCKDVYEDKACQIPDHLLRPDLDGRGVNYRQEFIQEIHANIKSVVSRIKQVRTKKGEL